MRSPSQSSITHGHQHSHSASIAGVDPEAHQRVEQELLRVSAIVAQLTNEAKANDDIFNHLTAVTDEINRERQKTSNRIEENALRAQQQVKECFEFLKRHAKEIDTLKRQTSDLLIAKMAKDETLAEGQDDDISITTTKSLLCLSCGNVRKMRQVVEALYSPSAAHVSPSTAPQLKAIDVARSQSLSVFGSQAEPQSAAVSSKVRPSYLAAMPGRKSERAATMYSRIDDVLDPIGTASRSVHTADSFASSANKIVKK
jgi:hypothetical protein